jgi:hypothetical protein
MSIENGTYVVTFGTPAGQGGGVIILQDGKLRGGDGAMIYIGSYNEPQPGHIDADVRVETHTQWPGQTSVFGLPTVNIKLAGNISGGSGTVQGQAAEAPSVPFTAKIERFCD